MPAYLQFFTVLFFAFHSCTNPANDLSSSFPEKVTPKNIRGISLPAGFDYLENGDTAYNHWLLDISLKENKTVYLYNGELKSNQNVQYGVLDIDIGKKDLIQCADAAIKIRADFLFNKHRFNELKFVATSGDSISFEKWLKGIRWKEQGSKLVSYKINNGNNNAYDEYKKFMELIFSYCGTYSLAKQLKNITDINSIQAGDVFIKGGFPGHAVTVMAVANDQSGERIFLLSQGYMPAQDIHILKNYYDPELSPWYSVKDLYPLYTPQWQFESGSLKRW